MFRSTSGDIKKEIDMVQEIQGYKHVNITRKDLREGDSLQLKALLKSGTICDPACLCLIDKEPAVEKWSNTIYWEKKDDSCYRQKKQGIIFLKPVQVSCNIVIPTKLSLVIVIARLVMY